MRSRCFYQTAAVAANPGGEISPHRAVGVQALTGGRRLRRQVVGAHLPAVAVQG